MKKEDIPKKSAKSINIDKNATLKNANFTKKPLIDSLTDSDNDNEPNNTDNIDNTDDNAYMVLALQDVIKSIPDSASNTSSPSLLLTHTEWRWRFFDLGGRKLVEISKLYPRSNR